MGYWTWQNKNSLFVKTNIYFSCKTLFWYLFKLDETLYKVRGVVCLLLPSLLLYFTLTLFSTLRQVSFFINFLLASFSSWIRSSGRRTVSDRGRSLYHSWNYTSNSPFLFLLLLIIIKLSCILTSFFTFFFVF